jgi:excisionase family DNA binding protein
VDDRQVTSPAGDEWLSTRALAGRLGICELSVRRWVRDGKLPPPVRLGRSVRWPWASVVEWVTKAS